MSVSLWWWVSSGLCVGFVLVGVVESDFSRAMCRSSELDRVRVCVPSSLLCVVWRFLYIKTRRYTHCTEDTGRLTAFSPP